MAILSWLELRGKKRSSAGVLRRSASRHTYVHAGPTRCRIARVRTRFAWAARIGFREILQGRETGMAYALIQFVEEGRPVATLCRLEHGQPTGADGVMDPLSAFIEDTAPTMLRQGSPGALYMAELFTAREHEAGREVRVVGGAGPLGISAGEVKALEGRGYHYLVTIGREGTRDQPSVHVRAVHDTGSDDDSSASGGA
jgi:hypothetical protein